MNFPAMKENHQASDKEIRDFLLLARKVAEHRASLLFATNPNFISRACEAWAFHQFIVTNTLGTGCHNKFWMGGFSELNKYYLKSSEIRILQLLRVLSPFGKFWDFLLKCQKLVGTPDTTLSKSFFLSPCVPLATCQRPTRKVAWEMFIICAKSDGLH